MSFLLKVWLLKLLLFLLLSLLLVDFLLFLFHSCWFSCETNLLWENSQLNLAVFSIKRGLSWLLIIMDFLIYIKKSFSHIWHNTRWVWSILFYGWTFSSYGTLLVFIRLLLPLLWKQNAQQAFPVFVYLSIYLCIYSSTWIPMYLSKCMAVSDILLLKINDAVCRFFFFFLCERFPDSAEPCWPKISWVLTSWCVLYLSSWVTWSRYCCCAY